MDKNLFDLAQRQGYVSAADATDLGINRMTLKRLVDAGRLLRTVRGVYLLADDRTPERRHRAVTQAALDADPWSAASHHSALVMHGIHLYGVPFDQVQVADPRRSSRSHRSLHRHVLREGDEVVTIDGYRVISLPLALCQTAARFGVAAGLVAMDHASASRCAPLMTCVPSSNLDASGSAWVPHGERWRWRMDALSHPVNPGCA